MARNLVICCDGTNNQFGRENTNVVRLVQALARNPTRQRLYYDPGVGTLPEPGAWGWLAGKVSEVAGLAFGAGLTWKVQQAYTYLMNTWEPGDRVFLFGFSRGAYAVRVLAGLLHALGLLPRGNENLLPYAFRLFKAVRREHHRRQASPEGRPHDESDAPGVAAVPANSPWERLCDEFRWTFARPVHEGDDARRFPVHFLGLWDTVSSVGWVWDPARFAYSTHNPSIATIRHAVSLDERRAFFRQNLMRPAAANPDQDLLEVWFPGVHADVGGGYPATEGGLWRTPFEWLLAEAQRAGLLIDPARLATVLGAGTALLEPWLERQHESLTARWWPAEFFPKLSRQGSVSLPRLNLGRARQVPAGALLDRSVLRRLRATGRMGYSPLNLPGSFCSRVRALTDAELPPQTRFEPY